MQTREELAREYAIRKDPAGEFVDTEVMQSHIDGAKSEHAELTRWNDPKDPPIHLNVWMLLKCANNKFDTGYWNGKRWRRWTNCEIIGWREIY